MPTLTRTNPQHAAYISLVNKLDKELAVFDGEDHAFYDQFNKSDDIKCVVILFDEGTAVSCGAVKELDKTTMEVKRMYTPPSFRKKGFASKVLTELERWACELGYKKCVLETGSKQEAAIRMYEKSGYRRVENYGQYANVENSRCYEKKLGTAKL